MYATTHPEHEEVNEFVRPPEYYKRDLDVVACGLESYAQYLHIQTRKPLEECLSWVKKNIGVEEGKRFQLKSKDLKVTFRKGNGDRTKAKMPFSKLLVGVKKGNHILSPNLVVYDDPDKNPSYISKYIDDRMVERSAVKKRGAAAKADGNKVLESWCADRQNTIKVKINSISGAHASPHNMLYCKTAHSTLTSTCRVATSYSNANTERFLAGNRHYYSVDITEQNLISLISTTNLKAFKEVMETYKLHYPTVEQTLAMIQYSTQFYWRDAKGQERIDSLVNQMLPLERAIVVYSGDFWHLAKYNEGTVKNLLTSLITIPEHVNIVENIDKVAGDDVQALASILCGKFLRGKKLIDIKINQPENWNIFLKTMSHLYTTLREHTSLFRTVLACKSLPSNIWYFPNSIRRCVIGSDTDSTMFTCQEWVKFYQGSLEFTETSVAVTNVMIYLNSQMVAHCLATASRQLGVKDHNLYRLKMKNEFFFPIYMRANRAKHYASLTDACEGMLYKAPDLDIKGVGLKDSKNPPEIMKSLATMLTHSMDSILKNTRVDSAPYLLESAHRETKVINSIESGSVEYLMFKTVKDRKSYTQDEKRSAYKYYTLWKDVFAPIYGECPEPDWLAVKVTLKTAKSRAKMDQWISTLEPEFANRMRTFLNDHELETMGELLLPYELVQDGLPKELLPIVDARLMVSQMFDGWYIFFEMLGFYFRNKNTTRLVSDEITCSRNYVEQFND